MEHPAIDGSISRSDLVDLDWLQRLISEAFYNRFVAIQMVAICEAPYHSGTSECVCP